MRNFPFLKHKYLDYDSLTEHSEDKYDEVTYDINIQKDNINFRSIFQYYSRLYLDFNNSMGLQLKIYTEDELEGVDFEFMVVKSTGLIENCFVYFKKKNKQWSTTNI